MTVVLIDSIKKVNNVYDVIAICYDILNDCLKKNHMQEYDFLATFVDEVINVDKKGGLTENDNEHNALASTINKLAYEVSGWADDSQLESNAKIDEFLRQIDSVITEISEELRDNNYLEAIVAYTVLLGCDKYVHNIPNSARRYFNQNSGPLNEKTKKHVRVYLSHDKSIIDKAMADQNMSESDTSTRGIRNQLQAVNIIREDEISSQHNITIRAFTIYNDFNADVKKMKIAVVPFMARDESKLDRIEGTGKFRIIHTKEYSEDYVDSIQHIMEKTLSLGCNIIVFPEFMIEDALLKRIKEILAKGNWPNLLFVVAGTRCVNINGSNTNELTVLDSQGQELGVYHKYAPYTAIISNKNIISSDNESTKEAVITEALDNPGDEIILLDIEKVGRFAFAICRDVCVEKGESNTIISRIIHQLHPHFLIVPAWSKSVASAFRTQFKTFGECRVVSILCDCCEAILINKEYDPHDPHDAEQTRSLIGWPSKERNKSCVEGCVQTIRCKECSRGECSHSDCFYVLNLNFKGGNFDKGKKILNKTIHYFD